MSTGTTVIPVDNTIPQITEGDQVMTQAITPKSATNLLVFDVGVMMASSTADNNHVVALFQDSTANALAASNVFDSAGGGTTQVLLQHSMTSGTTSSTTFKVRIGCNLAGTTTFNGASGTQQFSTCTKSWIQVTEYKV